MNHKILAVIFAAAILALTSCDNTDDLAVMQAHNCEMVAAGYWPVEFCQNADANK
jgi:uncharacterized lipoprotein NlpE involved in copper resistance